MKRGMPSWTRDTLAQCLGLDVFLGYNQRIIMYFHSLHRPVWGLETLDYQWKCLLKDQLYIANLLSFYHRAEEMLKKLLLGNLSTCCEAGIAVLYLTVGYSVLDSGALSLKL